MSKNWNRLFNEVKTGKKPSMSEVQSSRNIPQEHIFYGDDQNKSEMFNVSPSNDTVSLNSSKFIRQKRFVMSSKGAILIDDPHEVDYVLCHVKGYRKYFFGSTHIYYVKARDVIISGVYLSLEQITTMMKNELEKIMVDIKNGR